MSDGTDRLTAALAGRYQIERDIGAGAPRWSARLFADAANGAQKTTTCDVSPDGQRFLIRERSEQTSAAVQLLNWQSLLHRQPGER